MSWSNATLGDMMPGVVGSAQAAILSAQRELDALTIAIDNAQESLLVAQTQFNVINDLLESLASPSSGIYFINLSPAQGGWGERILNAVGAPPRNPSDFSAIIANFWVSADLSGAAGFAADLNEAKNKSFDPIPSRVKVPAFKPAIVTAPELPEPTAPNDDEWQSATMTDLFPGVRESVLQVWTPAKKGLEKLIKGIADLEDKKNEVQAKIDDSQALVNKLSASGVYNYTALPEVSPSADWFARLTDDSDPNRPAIDFDQYTSGSVTVILATNYADLLQKFNNIQKALTQAVV